jgi:hypothetical protein
MVRVRTTIVGVLVAAVVLAGVFVLGRASVARHGSYAAGHTAGEDDVFAGYDGGWDTTVPYVVSIAVGAGPVVYRIAARTPLQAGVNYYLCTDGHTLCQQARR